MWERKIDPRGDLDARVSLRLTKDEREAIEALGPVMTDSLREIIALGIAAKKAGLKSGAGA